MSYDIYFVKSDKLNSENIDEFLESDASDKDEHFISKSLMNEVEADLAIKGLGFERFEGKDEDYLELNLESYQISMFNSQIAVSLPYWDINSSDTIDNEIKLISKVLSEKGFTGYDPQTDNFFTDPIDFSSEFSHVNRNVEEYFSKPVSGKKTSEFWRLAKVGLIFVIVFLLIKLLGAMANRLF